MVGEMSYMWTPKEDEILKKMCVAHLSYKDMAQVLKSRTPDGIAKRIERQGLSNRPEPEIDHKKFKEIMNGSIRL